MIQRMKFNFLFDLIPLVFYLRMQQFNNWANKDGNYFTTIIIELTSNIHIILTFGDKV